MYVYAQRPSRNVFWYLEKKVGDLRQPGSKPKQLNLGLQAKHAQAGRFGGCHLDWTSSAMGFAYISCC